MLLQFEAKPQFSSPCLPYIDDFSSSLDNFKKLTKKF